MLSHVIFLMGIDQPTAPYFDEVHYVPAARQLLSGIGSQRILNPEHPPLAKELMAVGMRIFGDRALGWRYMSALFGSLTMVGMYLWAVALFDDEQAARWAALVTLVNQVLYVQARIAMLDVFLVAFLVWAMAAFTATWRQGASSRPLFAATGMFLGLATACKWTGVVPWAACVGIVLGNKMLQRRGPRSVSQPSSDWCRSDLWQSMRPRDWLICLGLIPVLVTFVTYVPMYGLSVEAFARAQSQMWRAQLSIAGTHPYMSHWTGWPFLKRPVWYLFEKVSGDVFQAVVFLGNPLVCWTGIVAIGVCLHGWIVSRRLDAFLIVAAYAALYLCWAGAPRALTLSYYYFPAAMVLSLALTFMFYKTSISRWPWIRRGFAVAAVVMFLYFLPVSSAAVTVTLRTFDRLMWFRSWI